MTRIREPGDGPKCACGRPAVWSGYCSMSDGIGSCNMRGPRVEPDVYYLDGKPQPVERHPPRPRHVPITFPPLDPLSEEGLYARVRKLEGELDAVKVLDAWAKKHVSAWAVDDRGGQVLCVGGDYLENLQGGPGREFAVGRKTAAEARIAAADALAKEDPSLLEGLE